MTGVSALAGGLTNRSKTSTSSTTPTYTGDQQGIQHQVSDLLSSRIQNPTDYIDKLHNGAIGGVNQNYAGVQTRMNRNLTGRGFGKSGKLALNNQALEIARAGELGGLESKFAGLQMNYDQSLMDMGSRFGFANPGQTGTSTQPGNVAGAAIGGGAETATTLYMLNSLLGGGGGGFQLPNTEIAR